VHELDAVRNDEQRFFPVLKHVMNVVSRVTALHLSLNVLILYGTSERAKACEGA
jgi:hypothetical protein